MESYHLLVLKYPVEALSKSAVVSHQYESDLEDFQTLLKLFVKCAQFSEFLLQILFFSICANEELHQLFQLDLFFRTFA